MPVEKINDRNTVHTGRNRSNYGKTNISNRRSDDKIKNTGANNKTRHEKDISTPRQLW